MVSSQPVPKSFPAALMDEVAALAADLPEGGPKQVELPPGHAKIGMISDPHTKALYFMLDRSVKEAQCIEADCLELQARKMRDSLSLEAEERTIDKRRCLSQIRQKALKTLFWLGVQTSVLDTLAEGGDVSLAVGPNWEIGLKKSKGDTFAEGLLGSLLAGKARVRFVDAADLLGR